MDAEPLRHLPRGWMYRAPLPRTKSESPLPALRLSGTRDWALELDGWPGMLGHNWGSQHAERWIWLHGHAFEDAPDAWLDIVVGRVKVGPLLTPVDRQRRRSSVDGERRRVDGRARVTRGPTRRATSQIGGVARRGALTAARTSWCGATPIPDGSEHHTANGSIATLTRRASDGRRLHTPHGGVYELGMRETDHGLDVLPFPDP